jgi:hypothetical protein
LKKRTVKIGSDSLKSSLEESEISSSKDPTFTVSSVDINSDVIENEVGKLAYSNEGDQEDIYEESSDEDGSHLIDK